MKIVRARAWWVALGTVVAAWVVVAAVRVGTYSESTDVPAGLEGAVYALPVVALVVLLVALAATVRARRSSR